MNENDKIIARIKGVPASPATPETMADPRNPQAPTPDQARVRDELRELSEKVTGGPWVAVDQYGTWMISAELPTDGHAPKDYTAVTDMVYGGPADAALIVALRNNIGLILTALDSSIEREKRIGGPDLTTPYRPVIVENHEAGYAEFVIADVATYTSGRKLYGAELLHAMGVEGQPVVGFRWPLPAPPSIDLTRGEE